MFDKARHRWILLAVAAIVHIAAFALLARLVVFPAPPPQNEPITFVSTHLVEPVQPPPPPLAFGASKDSVINPQMLDAPEPPPVPIHTVLSQPTFNLPTPVESLVTRSNPYLTQPAGGVADKGGTNQGNLEIHPGDTLIALVDYGTNDKDAGNSIDTCLVTELKHLGYKADEKNIAWYIADERPQDDITFNVTAYDSFGYALDQNPTFTAVLFCSNFVAANTQDKTSDFIATLREHRLRLYLISLGPDQPYPGLLDYMHKSGGSIQQIAEPLKLSLEQPGE